MENSFSSRYSITPPYQSPTTPLSRKPTPQFTPHFPHTTASNRSHNSSGGGSGGDPKTASSIQMNGDVDCDHLSSKLNGSLNLNTSPSPASKLAEMDSSTIVRQRKELQLMITELKDRDKELNELVQSHHKQLVSWEIDRERLSTVTKQLEKVKTEYRKRHEQCKLLKEKLRKYEGVIELKNKEVTTLKTNLQHVQDRDSSSANFIEEQEQKIKSLQSSINELSNTVGTLRAHEQQLETLLRLRENDLKDANIRITEITDKIRISNSNATEYKKQESDAKLQLVKCRSECTALRGEMEKMKASFQECLELEGQEEISMLKQEVICLQKELMLAGEREKRKDSLLELAKSRQERTEVELNNLRLIFNTMQSDGALKQFQWNNNDNPNTNNILDDDKLSVFSLSEYGEVKDSTIPIVLNSTTFLESPHTSLLASTEGQEMVDQFSPISGHNTDPDKSPLSLANEDAGTMSTGELRQTDLSSGDENCSTIVQKQGSRIQDDAQRDRNKDTPAVRLEKLLSASKQMVDDVEVRSARVVRNILEEQEEREEQQEESLSEEEEDKTALLSQSFQVDTVESVSEDLKDNKNVT